MYDDRFYRDWVDSEDLIKFEVKLGETDLLISAEKDLSEEARGIVKIIRKQIEDYISTHPEFKTSLGPIVPHKDAPLIAIEMCDAAKICNVGPMAAVAGAVAEYVGKELLFLSNQVIVENGGDIFIKSDKKRNIAIFAGKSCLSQKIAIEILPGQTPLGVCTSSGTVGPSLSFGKADAVTIISKSAILADAAATQIANMVNSEADIEKAIQQAKHIKGIIGVVAIKNQKLGVWGDIRLAQDFS